MGLNVNGDELLFTTAAGGKKCDIFFYDRRGKNVGKHEMEHIFGEVFKAVVEKSDLPKNAVSYNFSTDEGFKEDYYARQLTGNAKFGKNENVHASLFPNIVEAKVPHELLPLDELIIYKLHVRSFTALASGRVKHPGTFKGVTEKIGHLTKLGVTGVLLMPVFSFSESYETGIINFWGYNCRNTFFFAPKNAYSSDPDNAPAEFSEMIDAFHKAGMDVYLEMIFNEDTPMSYIVECLRTYANVYHVDGFRINDFQISSKGLLSDPYLSACRFFATGVEDSLVEKYPGRIVKTTDSFMNDVRRFIKADEGFVPTVYSYMKNRAENAGVRYITDNNGFTLHDLYTYDVKHNEANGENGKDGSVCNYSWNCGVEGECNIKKIKNLRMKMMKNAILVMMLSGGVPQILQGDEIGRTKQGNNNTYCQDNEISYLDWEKAPKNREISSFYRKMIELRKSHPVFTSLRELRETDYACCGLPEISLHGENPWLVNYEPYNRVMGVYFCGGYIKLNGSRDDEDFYLMMNMHWERHEFRFPVSGEKYTILADTDCKENEGKTCTESLTVEPRSIVLISCKRRESR